MSSRTFKDINLSFKRHPVTNDLVTIRDEDAIKRSVRNIIFTILGEKPFEPNFGSVINDALFDLDTNLNEIRIQDEITSSMVTPIKIPTSSLSNSLVFTWVCFE